MRKLKQLLNNLTKGYMSKIAKVLTAKKLYKLFETWILDPTNPLHLEAMVGSTLRLYGLLQSCKTMRFEVGDVLDEVDASMLG